MEAERRLATQLGMETGGIRHWILVDTAEEVQPGHQRTILSSALKISVEGRSTRTMTTAAGKLKTRPATGLQLCIVRKNIEEEDMLAE